MCLTAAKSKKLQATYPLSPAAPNAEEVSRFKFDTVSPDEAVLEAQKRVTGSAEPSAVHQQQQRSTLQSTRDEATPPVTHGKLRCHQSTFDPCRHCYHTVLFGCVCRFTSAHSRSNQVKTKLTPSNLPHILCMFAIELSSVLMIPSSY